MFKINVSDGLHQYLLEKFDFNEGSFVPLHVFELIVSDGPGYTFSFNYTDPRLSLVDEPCVFSYGFENNTLGFFCDVESTHNSLSVLLSTDALAKIAVEFELVSGSVNPSVATLSSINELKADLIGYLNAFSESVEGQFSSRFQSVDSQFMSVKENISSSADGIQSHLTLQDETLTTVSESVSNIDLSAIDLTSLASPSFLTELSLNGRGGSFVDGQRVTILGLDGIFKVEHSVQMLSNNTSLEQLFFYRCSRVDRPEIVIFAPKQLVVLSSL
jgi:hypothetical protein